MSLCRSALRSSLRCGCRLALCPDSRLSYALRFLRTCSWLSLRAGSLRPVPRLTCA